MRSSRGNKRGRNAANNARATRARLVGDYYGPATMRLNQQKAKRPASWNVAARSTRARLVGEYLGPMSMHLGKWTGMKRPRNYGANSSKRSRPSP